MTTEMPRRMSEHARGKVSATRSLHEAPQPIFFEAFRSKEHAMRRERYFKTTKGKRALKLMLM